MQVHSSLAFCRFVFCGFANAWGLPKNKNMLLGPISGWQHQNCSTILTGLSAIPHDVKDAEGNKEAPPITVFLQRKEKH